MTFLPSKAAPELPPFLPSLPLKLPPESLKLLHGYSTEAINSSSCGGIDSSDSSWRRAIQIEFSFSIIFSSL